MTGHAYTRPAPPSPSEHFRQHTDFLRWELAPDDRVGAPPARRHKRGRWLALAVMVLAGGGIAMIDDKIAAWNWTTAHLETTVSLGRSLIGEATPKYPPPTAPPPVLPVLSTLEPLDSAPVRTAGQEMSPLPAVAAAAPEPLAKVDDESGGRDAPAEPATAASAEADKPAPLPPLPPLTDPLQKKAESVGLHPELSRALLQRLTATDFKNAAIAIKKAIAETADGSELVWPARPARGLARFRIHFVPGISQACRRYVVGVAKDGWLTTALPMEKCGVKPRPGKEG